MPAAANSEAVVKLPLKVVPGASRCAIAGWFGDALRVRVSAPPERGRANAEVIRLLAQRLGLPGSALAIVGGSTSARKTLRICGLERAEVMRRLGGETDE